MANRKFSDYEKKTIYAKCNGICSICGRPVPFDKITIDHEIPLSKGGTNDFSNLRIAHMACNRAKADLMRDELIRLAGEIIRYNRVTKIKSIFAKEIM